MTQTICQTIYDDKLKVYKFFRRDFDLKISECEKERVKIQRRKKNKKEKQRALRANTIEKMAMICQVIKKTFKHYKEQYFESDNYRSSKILEIIKENKERVIKEFEVKKTELDKEWLIL